MSVLYKHNDEIERVAGAYRPYVINPRPDWAKAVAISTAQLEAGYTTPSDGMIVGYGYGLSHHSPTFSVNNVAVARCAYIANAFVSYACVQVPVNKGDIFKSNDALIEAENDFHFVPWRE